MSDDDFQARVEQLMLDGMLFGSAVLVARVELLPAWTAKDSHERLYGVTADWRIQHQKPQRRGAA